MKKLRDILFWSGVFLVILTYILIKPLDDLDEIWNFNTARCIADGLIPYKDISMITTPLLGFITALFLKIFGTEMFVTRIMAALLAVVSLIVIYNICRKLEIEKSISKLLILIIMFIMKEYYCLDYNFLVLTITLIIMLLELKYIKNNNQSTKNDIIIGILGGLSFCTKQSIGFLVSVIVVLSPLFDIKSKSNFKKILKKAYMRIIGILVPILIFFIYLIITGAFSEFFSYCVWGIKTFSNSMPYEKLITSEDITIKILSIISPIILIISIAINIIFILLKKRKNFLLLLTAYSLPIFTMSYPISDNIHFLISIVPMYILFIYEIKLLLKGFKIINLKYLFEFIEIISFVFIIIFTGYTEIKYRNELGELSKYKALKHFNNIIVSKNILNLTERTDEYILTSEKDVYILDSNVALYMIPIDRYNKNFDMFQKGNFGKDGENGQIDKINSQENVRYMILREDYIQNWQTPQSVITYVRENFNKIGEVGVYDIYEKGNGVNIKIKGIKSEVIE